MPRWTARRGSRGSITVETAMALPVLLFVLAVALWGISAAAAALRCGDAARVAARAVARGDSVADARRAALSNAPQGAVLTFQPDESLTTVRVTADVRPVGMVARMFP